MPIRLLFSVALSAILASGVSPNTAQQIASLQADRSLQEPFKSGVELVQIDVSVLDKAGDPVRGLTVEDFTIREDGTPQSIMTFVPVDLSAPARKQAAWMRNLEADVISNDYDPKRRLVAIVMNDASTEFDAGEPTSARKIARGVIDQLAPADMAAVIFTYSGKAQNFTTDRTKLLAAVDSFVPRSSRSAGPPLACVLRGCVIETLKNVATVLQNAPVGRKLVVFIGSNAGLEVNVNSGSLLPVTPLLDMFSAMQAANITVNAFDPGGLRTHGPVGRTRVTGNLPRGIRTSSQRVDELRALAENTGGKTFVETNAPEVFVPDIFRQNSYYYLLGFRSSAPPDGRFRRIDVRVNRRDVTIRSRSGYYAQRRTEGKAAAQPTNSIDAALESGLFTTDYPISMNIATFAKPDRREAVVCVTSGLRVSATSRRQQSQESRIGLPFEVIAVAFDQEWRERGRVQQTVILPANERESDELYDVHSWFSLRPGRYEFRVAAQGIGRIGSVIGDVDLPDFLKDGLSASTAVLARTPARTPQEPRPVGILPIIPTVLRQFDRSDRVIAFVRFYQRGGKGIAPVVITTRIINDADQKVLEETTALMRERFASDRSADYQFELPLGRFADGPHLLMIEAVSGEHKVRRHVAFTVGQQVEND